MSRKKKNRITAGGNFTLQGQNPSKQTIVLTQPKRFNIDIADYTQSIRQAENVDFSRRAKLYDLYSDILMDAHLSAVLNKRTLAVLSSNIEFKRNGETDDAISEQIRSPWFRRFVKDVLDAQFWGFTLCQFYRDGEWVEYDLIPRKHVDPVRELILKQQTDVTGSPWSDYADLVFVGEPRELGALAKAAYWVIYKRNTVSDWAQFSEIFGTPIREYVYETDDDEARQRAINDAENAGSLAVLIHSKDSTLNLLESGNKSGTADLYERLCERCNSEISKLILGNTLTTESSTNGTQALGTVHQKVEERVAQADRQYVLDTLNYEMADVFAALGINTLGGEFCFPEPKNIDLAAKASILTQLRTTFNLPISDDYLYAEFGVEKPENYDQLKQQAAQQPEPKQLPTPGKDDLDDDPDNLGKSKPTAKPFKSFKSFNSLKSLKSLFRFFAQALDKGALKW
jgi:phage gp29-like protein